MNIKNNRLISRFNVTILNGFKSVSCVYDTGAMYTTVRSKSIGIKSYYEETLNKELEVKYFGGFINCEGCNKNKSAKYYKLHLNKVSIGNVVLSNIPIWVTFDERVTDDVIGMDIISRLYTFIGDGRAHITNDKNELRDYLTKSKIVLRTDLPPIL